MLGIGVIMTEPWKCECGADNSTAFCTSCGKANPDMNWKCTCGTENTTPFCGECGRARVQAKQLKKSDASESQRKIEDIVHKAASNAANQAARTITREIVNDVIKALKG